VEHRVVRRPRPGAERGAEELEVADDGERADVQQPRAAPREEPEQAEEPDGAERVAAVGEQDAVRRPAAADGDGGGDQGPGVPPRRPRPADGESREVDEAVAGRDEGRDGTDPVDVRLEQRGERVLDGRREADDERRLGADQGGLAAQEAEEDGPGDGPQDELPGGLVTVERGDGVREQHDGDPADDDAGDPEVAVAERCHGPRVSWATRHPSPGVDHALPVGTYQRKRVDHALPVRLLGRGRAPSRRGRTGSA